MCIHRKDRMPLYTALGHSCTGIAAKEGLVDNNVGQRPDGVLSQLSSASHLVLARYRLNVV